ncbi:methyltransferase domain-containing protein (plasmid) [Rhizobium sp. CB3090]|uniref:methyltransferase domain-containing protein n=1 Tax=Rhizobium sp. CB3090 TaxID=3039156 RepID=UPI0024B27AC8|nr:methyltransferase domain-containing protein [Rhizobium sp. CB3090]WFU12349.1 methyltransferase domain-containing protein [Rhizobium sp. CB3090]
MEVEASGLQKLISDRRLVDREKVLEAAREAYDNADRFSALWNPGRGEISKSYNEKVASGFFEKYFNGGTVLDIDYSNEDNPLGLAIVKHAVRIDWGLPGMSRNSLSYGGESVDTVSSSHLLEMVMHPHSTIQEWFRVLKVGGFLVCFTAHQYLYEKRKFLPSAFNPFHAHFFTPAKLLQLFEEALEPNSYRLRHLQDNDLDYDYTVGPEQHSMGCYELEIVIEKIAKPQWDLA